MSLSAIEEKIRNKNYTTQKSEEAFEKAQELMPGGVNSPVRACRSVGGQPVFIDRAKGSRIWDIDGNEYIDYVGSFGPGILGHADDEILTALSETMKKGTSFGAPCLLENDLAEMVISAVPSIELVRFVNSGTEACMAVLRLARAFTGGFSYEHQGKTFKRKEHKEEQSNFERSLPCGYST